MSVRASQDYRLSGCYKVVARWVWSMLFVHNISSLLKIYAALSELCHEIPGVSWEIARFSLETPKKLKGQETEDESLNSAQASCSGQAQAEGKSARPEGRGFKA